MSRWLVGCAVVFLCLPAMLGCGRGLEGAPKTVAVTGTVHFKGQPVAGATVSLVPKGAGLRSAVGVTDTAGRFKLTTLTPGDGAMPGSYAVEISKIEGGAAAGAPAADDPVAASEKAAKEGRMGTQAGPDAVKDLLPAKYKKASTSKLTAEVKEQGNNDFQFDLTE